MPGVIESTPMHPDVSRMARWLAAHGSSPVAHRDPVLGLVERAYREILGRDADPSGLARWGESVRQGLTYSELCKQLGESPEGLVRASRRTVQSRFPFENLRILTGEAGISIDTTDLAMLAGSLLVCQGRLPELVEVSAAVGQIGTRVTPDRAARWALVQSGGRRPRRRRERQLMMAITVRAVQLEHEVQLAALSSRIEQIASGLGGVIASVGQLTEWQDEGAREVSLRLAQMAADLGSVVS